MASQEERISRLEGIIEQINERLAAVEKNVSMLIDRKADKTEVRLVLVTMVALFSVVFGLLGVILTKV